jgi:hypothetical protein
MVPEMSRTLPPVRFIKPDSIQIGDTIKVDKPFQDSIVSHIGIVAKREHLGDFTEYRTTQGVILLEHNRRMPEKVKITLIKRALETVSDVLF